MAYSRNMGKRDLESEARLLAALAAATKGYSPTVVVVCCANMIGQAFASRAKSLEDADDAIDDMAAALKRWVGNNWKAPR